MEGDRSGSWRKVVRTYKLPLVREVSARDAMVTTTVGYVEKLRE